MGSKAGAGPHLRLDTADGKDRRRSAGSTSSSKHHDMHRDGDTIFNSQRHPWVCLMYGCLVGPFAALELVVSLMINLVTGIIVTLSLVIPFLEWWSRAELALGHFRECLLLLGMMLSAVVPCLPSILVADLDESRAWRMRPLPTICGCVEPHRSRAFTCFFPNARRPDPDFESEGDSCLPSGADCLETCCACSCRDCLELCCTRVAFEETPFVSPLATPASTPGVTPTTQRRLVALAAAQSNSGDAGNSNGGGGGGQSASESNPQSQNNSTSRLLGDRSPRTDRRGGSLRRRYKTLAFKPNAAHSSLEEQLNHVLSFDISGDYVVTTTGSGTIYIWNIYTHECLMSFQAPSVKVAWSPRGDVIASTVITPSNGYVYLFDFVNGREAMRIQTQHRLKPLDNIAWSKDGLYLAVTGDSKVGTTQQQMISIYDSKVGGLIRDLSTGESNNAPVVAWSPHMHRLLAFSGAESSIRVFDALSGVIVRVLTGAKSSIRSLSWCPHTSRSWHVAAGTSNGSVLIFDITSGQCLREITGLRVNVWCVTWSPLSPDYIATLDGSIRVFDTTSGEQHYEIPCASISTSMCVEWLPGSRSVILSAEANGVRTFELRGLNDLLGPTGNSSSSLRNQVSPLQSMRENSGPSPPTPPSPSVNQGRPGTPPTRRVTLSMEEFTTSPLRLPIEDSPERSAYMYHQGVYGANGRPQSPMHQAFVAPPSSGSSGYSSNPNNTSNSALMSLGVGGSPLGPMMVRVASRGSSSNSSHPHPVEEHGPPGRMKPSRASSNVSRSSGDSNSNSKSSITRYLNVGEPESEEDEANFAFDPDEQVIITTATHEIPLADDEVVVSFV